MSERIVLSQELRDHLLSPASLPRTVQVNQKIYTVEKPVAAGFKAAVWKVNDEFGRSRALKLCVYDDYKDRSYLQEAMRAAELEDYGQFAKFVDAGLTTISLGPSLEQTFVCFVEGWIGFCPTFTDTWLRLIMGQEGCHGTETKVFSGIQA